MPKNKEKHSDDIEMVLLKTTDSSPELNFIINILDENGIPYILKDRGIGGYMRIAAGFSLYGTDILVEKSTLEEAKDILDNYTNKE